MVGTFNQKKIKYTTNVNIDITQVNKSKVRFYLPPIIEITPLLTFATTTNTTEQNPKFLTGSFYSKAVFPQHGFNVNDNTYNKSSVDYQIVTNNSFFTSSLNSFFITLNVNSIKNVADGANLTVNDTSSILIKNVINNTTLQLDVPYIYKNPSNNKGIITEVISGSYTVFYSDYIYRPDFFTTASYLTESIGVSDSTRYKQYSIAEITYRNLDTFSGNITRHKIYRKSLNIASDYTVILDENFGSNEILKNDTVPIKIYQNLGSFYSQDYITKFWFTSSNNFVLQNDNNYYINGLHISGSSTINNGYILTKLNTSPSTYRNSTYIPYNQTEYLNQSGSSYDTNFLKLLKDNEYILSFNCNLIKKPMLVSATLDFYITGSYTTNNNESTFSSVYGIKIADLVVSDKITFKNFHNTIKFKFKPKNDIYGTLIIVPRGFDNLIINNLSIKSDKTTGFSPNTYTVRVPFNINQPNELFDIKAELYDNNANLVYSNLRTIQTFDPSGSSSPSSAVGGDAVFSTLKLTNLPTLGSGKQALYISGSIIGY
jgi:hypothetical protein